MVCQALPVYKSLGAELSWGCWVLDPRGHTQQGRERLGHFTKGLVCLFLRFYFLRSVPDFPFHITKLDKASMSNTEPFNNLCLQVVSEVLSSTPPAAGYGQDQGEPGTGEPGPILENPHSGHRFGEQRRGQIKMKNPKNSFYLNKDNNSDWPHFRRGFVPAERV